MISCTKCKTLKSPEEFNKGKKTCKSCVKHQQSVLKSERLEVQDTNPRVCTACEKSQAPSNFERTGTGSYRLECRSCRKAKRKQKSEEARVDHKPELVPKPDACVKCGEGPERVGFKWRSDGVKGNWRQTCNTCYNKNQYHTAYRERERAKDEKAYLAHNAEIHLTWAHNNPEKIKEQQVKRAISPEHKIAHVRTTAKSLGVAFSEEDAFKMQEKLSMPCAYCAYEPTLGENLNGLDRLYNNDGFTDANTVPCCIICNAMKGVMSPDEFISAVRDIYSYSVDDVKTMPSPSSCRTLPQGFCGSAARREAEPVDKTNHLSDEESISLWGGACHLCGRTPAFGIDRIDSSIGYESSNVRPCCTSCNMMKKDLELDAFKLHVAFINTHCIDKVLEDIMDLPVKFTNDRVRLPVRATLNDGRRIVFPSERTAKTLLGSKAFAKMKWEVVTPHDYRANRFQGVVADVLRTLRDMKK